MATATEPGVTRPSEGADRSTTPWWRPAAPGLVVGAGAALVRLDRDALWLDEAYTLGAVHQLADAVPRTDWTMSAYYLVLRGWLVVSESVWWMRALSVLAGLAALALTVAVVRRLKGDAAARLAGVLVALGPMWWAYAREARAYGMVMALVALTWLAVDHGLAGADGEPGDDLGDDAGTSARWWWWVHTAACVVLPFGHGLAVLSLVPQLAVVAVARPGRAVVARAGRGVGAALALTGLLALGASDGVGEWVAPLSWEEVGFTIERFLHSHALVAGALLVVVLGGAVVGAVDAVRAPTAVDRARALVPALWGLAPIVLLALLSAVRPSFVPRYAVGAAPGLAVLLAVAVARVTAWRRVAGAVLAAAVLAALVGGIVDLQTRPLDGWRLAARRVAADARPGDTVLLSREATTRPPFEAAWRDVDPAAEVLLLPSDRPLGRVLRFEPDETDNDVRWNEARSAERLWVVGDTRRLELDRLPSLVDGSAGRPPSHREVGRWTDSVGGVTVVLLEPLR